MDIKVGTIFQRAPVHSTAAPESRNSSIFGVAAQKVVAEAEPGPSIRPLKGLGELSDRRRHDLLSSYGRISYGPDILGPGYGSGCAQMNGEFQEGTRSAKHFCFPRGIIEYLEASVPKPVKWPSAPSYDFTVAEARVLVAIQGSMDPSAQGSIRGFSDNYSIDKGTHIDGLMKAFKKVPGFPATGVYAIIHVELKWPAYQGQTRERLVNTELLKAIGGRAQ